MPAGYNLLPNVNDNVLNASFGLGGRDASSQMTSTALQLTLKGSKYGVEFGILEFLLVQIYHCNWGKLYLLPEKLELSYSFKNKFRKKSS